MSIRLTCMSYDVHLFRSGEDDPAAAYALLENDAGPPGPMKEERKRRLAEEVRSRHPTMVETKRDFAQIASEEGISEKQARWENREIEMVAPGFGGQKVQIDLFDDDARVSLEAPNHLGDEEALSLAWECLSTLVAAGGFVPYDPQLEREIDLERDFEAVLARLRSFVDEQSGLARAAAAELAEVWESYWPVRTLTAEEVARQHPRLSERGRTVIRLALQVMDASDLSDRIMARALGLLLELGDDYLLIDWALSSNSEFELLPWQLADRSKAEQIAVKIGIADWCSRVGHPLLDSDGNPLGCGEGPLPGELRARDLRTLILASGAPGAERAAPDALRDLNRTVGAALPVSQEVLNRLEVQAGVPAELRAAADLHGHALMRAMRISFPPLFRDASLRGDSEMLHHLDTRASLVLLVANCLVLVAAAETIADLDGVFMFDTSTIASLR